MLKYDPEEEVDTVGQFSGMFAVLTKGPGARTAAHDEGRGARLSVRDVYEYCESVCFRPGPVGTVGAEVEWLVVDPRHPSAHVSPQRWRGLLANAGYVAHSRLPGGGTVTAEPGGQLEISSAPSGDLKTLHRAMRDDLRTVQAALARDGLVLVGRGTDSVRRPLLQTDDARYLHMSSYFGRPGLDMMCTTAALQINLDIGTDTAEASRRWRLAHRLGPVLVAAFANSPLRAEPIGPCRRSGLKSSRQAIWAALDPGRTRAPKDSPDVACGPATAWARYALDAKVMMVRTPHGLAPASGMTFGEWLACDTGTGPTRADLEHHLTTLFPPVRPRGWLELRMIDAVPDPWWAVAVALACVLMDDPEATDRAAEAVEPLASEDDVSLRAARDAMADSRIATAARSCFVAAGEALARRGATALLTLLDEYLSRYVLRGRCPADDVLDGVARLSLPHEEIPCL